MTRLLVALLALLLVPVAGADDKKIEALIQQLGARRWVEREKATADLIAMGGKALDAVRKAASHDDAEIAARARAIIHELTQGAEVRARAAFERAGKLWKERALPQADRSLGTAHGNIAHLPKIDHDLAEGMVVLGERLSWTLVEDGHYATAASCLDRALALQARRGVTPDNTGLRGELAYARGYVAALRARHVVALQHLERARSLLGDDDERQVKAGWIELTIASVQLARARYDDADRAITAALAIWKKTPRTEPGSPLLAACEQARVLLRRGKRADAARRMTTVMPKLEALHAAKDADVLDLCVGLVAHAEVLLETGKLPAAVKALTRALPLLEDRLGIEDHPELALPTALLGEAYRRQGKVKQANEQLNRARTLATKRLGKTHPLVGLIESYRAHLFLGLGKHADAERSATRALTIATQLAPDHPRIATTLDLRARIYAAQGKTAAATADRERARTLRAARSR